MEWLEFKPWSKEVAQKMSALHAEEAKHLSREKKPECPPDWKFCLHEWPLTDPWGGPPITWPPEA